MNIFFIIIGSLIFVIASFALYRFLKVKRQYKIINLTRSKRVESLYQRLSNNESVTSDIISSLAKNILTREMTFRLLHQYHKSELFPGEFYTIEKGGESSLANWLEFPTELGSCPDEMEHLKRVTIDFDGQNHFVHYEVYRFKINDSHWAAKKGWMLGVAGPYFDDSLPYDPAYSTFSRMGSPIEKFTPDEEAIWVHENVSKRKFNLAHGRMSIR